MPVKALLNSFTHCYAELRFSSAHGAAFRGMQHPDRLIPCMLDRNLRLLLWFLSHASSVS